MPTIIEIRGLVKTYDALPVLRKLDLDIETGQFVALLGPNGSGKSTLLRLITGLTKPTAGTIVINGWEIPREAMAVRAHIGVVSHKTLLYDNLTAYENLFFYAGLYDLPERDARIRELLSKVGLHKRTYDLVRTFSRGMQQRLSIARALLHNPDVLMLDEPYTGLDQDAAGILDDLLWEAQKDGHTIIMATHQLERAARLVDRLIILSRGRVRHDGLNEARSPLHLAETYTEVTGAAAAR